MKIGKAKKKATNKKAQVGNKGGAIFLQERVAKISRQGWLYGLASMVAVFGVFAVWFGGSVLAQQFPITSVQIGGQFRQVDKKEIESLLAEHVSNDFFSVDLKSIQHTLEALPWVYRVSVRRVWPDRIYVSIDEQSAVALWQQDKLINADGNIFAPERIDAKGFNKSLPRLLGPEGKSKTVMAAYHQMGRMLKRANLDIEELRLSDRMTWQLTLSNNVDILLDNQKSLEKLERFVEFYLSDLLDRVNSIEEVDLRYENGIALSWQADQLVALNKP